MAVEQIKVHDLVDRAVAHRWSVPEFQRGFVWKPVQVRDLAESLWRNYPIGSLLLWHSRDAQEARVARDGMSPGSWIVDGQQRTTALAILFNRKPYWWQSAEEWNRTVQRYDVRFDVDARDDPYFRVADAVIRRTHGNRYVQMHRLLALNTDVEADRKTMTDLAREIKAEGLCDGMDATDVYSRLDQVRRIREMDVLTVAVDHELEEVVEIFARLNSKGTRIHEADIYLGIVAARTRGWVREEFLPFLGVLESFGFRVDPNLLFRSLTAIGAGRVRFKEIQESFWDSAAIGPAWERCKSAWGRLIRRLASYGVVSDDPLPTRAALVTLAALEDKFPDQTDFDPAMYWFLQASRFGRYSGSATTASEEDLRDIGKSSTQLEALTQLSKQFSPSQPFAVDDFKRDYTDGRFFTFLLYLMVFARRARNWDNVGDALAFDGRELVADYRPQWHHIFPVKYLQGHDEAAINQLANIAVIGPTINIRISAQSPMTYFDKYSISDEKLEQQFIDPAVRSATREDYPKFADCRAALLADAANEYLARLGRALESGTQSVGVSSRFVWDAGDVEIVQRPNVARPRVPVAHDADAGDEVESSEIRELQAEFWRGFIKYVKEHEPSLRLRAPFRHYLDHSIGRSGFHLTLYLRIRKRQIGCALWIDHPDSKRAFAELQKQRAAIDGEADGHLDWEELPNRHACRIAMYRDASFSDRETWPELFEWSLGRLKILSRLFAERVKALDLPAARGRVEAEKE